jgi:hypothetical protein
MSEDKICPHCNDVIYPDDDYKEPDGSILHYWCSIDNETS